MTISTTQTQNTPSTDQTIQSKSICVVGAACSMRGKGLGALIDSHDDVIRVNEHKTLGFEDDSGIKTTILCTYRDCLAKKERKLNELWLFVPGKRLLTIVKTPNELHETYLGNELNAKLCKPKLITIFGSPPWASFPGKKPVGKVRSARDAAAVEDTTAYRSQQPFPGSTDQHHRLHRPSTGLMAIVMAVYGYQKVSIVGFGNRDKVRLGYYDRDMTGTQRATRQAKTAHNFEKERLIINAWEQQGLLTRIDNDPLPEDVLNGDGTPLQT